MTNTIIITYRLFNATSDSTMNFHGTNKGAEEYARRLVKSGGWLSASINGKAIATSSKKRNHANIVPALTSLGYKTKELEKVALTRELTPDEVVQLTVLFQEVVKSMTPLAPNLVEAVAPPPAPKVEPDPGVPSFDPLRPLPRDPMSPTPKVDPKQPEPKKAGLFTR